MPFFWKIALIVPPKTTHYVRLLMRALFWAALRRGRWIRVLPKNNQSALAAADVIIVLSTADTYYRDGCYNLIELARQGRKPFWVLKAEDSLIPKDLASYVHPVESLEPLREDKERWQEAAEMCLMGMPGISVTPSFAISLAALAFVGGVYMRPGPEPSIRSQNPLDICPPAEKTHPVDMAPPLPDMAAPALPNMAASALPDMMPPPAILPALQRPVRGGMGEDYRSR